MKKLTRSALDSLFNVLNKPDGVFWIRDKSYRKQIYLSPTFEQIWGISNDKMYNDPEGEILKATFLEDEGKKKWLSLDQTKRALADNNSFDGDNVSDSRNLIRIKNAKDNQERYLIDENFILVDDNGEHLGFAGLSELVSKDEWYARYYAEKSQNFELNNTSSLKKHIFDVLNKEAGIVGESKSQHERKQNIRAYWVNVEGKKISFTKRESQCIHYLLQGLSAKQTADRLCVSQRTVEFHISNACQKAKCNTKLALSCLVKTEI